MEDIQHKSERHMMDYTLRRAVTEGNVQRFNELLQDENQPPPRTSRLLQGVTSDWDGVLHIAARLEHVELVRAISDGWAMLVDVAAKNRRGETPLHCAAATEEPEMINLLILMSGSHEKQMELVSERKCNGETCLHDAVRRGNRQVASRLIAADVSVQYIRDRHRCRALVQIEDNEGVSPLYLATTLGNLEMVQLLTERPQDHRYAASCAGPEKKTALHAAVLLRYRSTELSQHLVVWNPNLIKKTDLYGNTPLHLLASSWTTRQPATAKLLLDRDASAGYLWDAEGALPIHVAAANGCLDMIKLLLEHCPDCYWPCSNFGQTILHIAVQQKNYNVVRYVCSGQRFLGILNTRDADGNTALHLAVLKGNVSIFRVLLGMRQIFLSPRNKEERTPLDLASLGIPPGVSFTQPRQWIANDLVLAKAEYGTGRWDHFSTNFTTADKEKNSEAISKSAGLMAVCAVLILNVAFAAPFNVSKFYIDSSNASSTLGRAKMHVYKAFMVSDALAFVFSAAATSCCTLAGISVADRNTRFTHLAVGWLLLELAALCMLAVFMSGVYVVASPVGFRFAITACAFAILATLPHFTMSAMLFLSVRTLIKRVGVRTWCRTLLPSLRGMRLIRIIVMLVVSATIIGLSFL
ncbi:hypothetical protein VPH35_127304 [Triticum aestivum]|uniref:PGG domain-containing protein n=1 Tax=Triticum aestivum TaxID=4565 RepID=A0A3B6SDG0_WHEAT|nr:protein ACCELERATED CELL DEATH 6-like [Triticum aestivum]